MAEGDAAPPVKGAGLKKLRCFRICGQVYYGECKEVGGVLLRHGSGKQVICGKTVKGETLKLSTYDGYWNKDEMTGRGSYTWYDGSSYDGDFANGDLNGVGKFRWPDGSSYDGTWLKGQMHGQGRFESRLGADFLEGSFHRNSFQGFDGGWVHVLKQHRKMERQELEAGDKRRIPVVRCSSPGDLEATMNRLLDEDNLVPFIVSDQRQQETSPLDWLEEATDETTIHVSYAARSKRRQHDYQKLLYGKIQASLLTMQPFTVVFGDPRKLPGNQGSSTGFSDTLPAEWQLSHLFDDHSFPLELFDLRLFHGRYKVDYFLPPEKRSTWLRPPGDRPPAPADEGSVEAASNAAEEGGEAPAADGEPGAEAGDETETKEAAQGENAGKIDETPTVYLLRFCVVALGKIDAGRGADAIREDVVRQFSQHLPLHRCAIVVLE